MDSLVIAVSTETLFEQQRDIPILRPGSAFHFISKLAGVNSLLDMDDRVQIILLSKEGTDTSLQVFTAVEHYKLPIFKAIFTGGASVVPYLAPLGVHLYLSMDEEDVRDSLHVGVPAAIVSGTAKDIGDKGSMDIRIAFDGDAVLFSDEAERVFQSKGRDCFIASERAAANRPLPCGPFYKFLIALNKLKREFKGQDCPINLTLITVRPTSTIERVARTLRKWEVDLDGYMFLCGLDKQDFFKAYRPDIVFDDRIEFCKQAATITAAGHVPYGILNEVSEITQDRR